MIVTQGCYSECASRYNFVCAIQIVIQNNEKTRLSDKKSKIYRDVK